MVVRAEPFTPAVWMSARFVSLKIQFYCSCYYLVGFNIWADQPKKMGEARAPSSSIITLPRVRETPLLALLYGRARRFEGAALTRPSPPQTAAVTATSSGAYV